MFCFVVLISYLIIGERAIKDNRGLVNNGAWIDQRSSGPDAPPTPNSRRAHTSTWGPTESSVLNCTRPYKDNTN